MSNEIYNFIYQQYDYLKNKFESHNFSTNYYKNDQNTAKYLINIDDTFNTIKESLDNHKNFIDDRNKIRKEYEESIKKLD